MATVGQRTDEPTLIPGRPWERTRRRSPGACTRFAAADAGAVSGRGPAIVAAPADAPAAPGATGTRVWFTLALRGER